MRLSSTPLELFGALGCVLALGCRSPTIDPRDVAQPHAVQRLTSGDQLVVVLIGSSTCGASKMGGFANAVRTVKGGVSEQARSEGSLYESIGVSVDWDPNVGARWLDSLGRFDEIVTGMNWLNEGALHLIWLAPGGTAALPQVQVFRRHIEVSPSGISVTEQELLLRIVGAGRIIQWARHGAPLTGPVALAAQGTLGRPGGLK